MIQVNHTRIFRRALLLATLAVPLPALAVNKSYIGLDGGLWSDGGNWVNPGMPLNGDSASLLSNTDKTIQLDVNYSAPGLSTLDLDGSSFATVTLSQPGGTTMRASNQEHVGYLGRGRYLQTGGDNLTPSLTLGLNGGSYGAYDLSGGTISASEFWVGYAGTGVMTQTGGAVTAALALRLGSTSSGNGTYSITNGSVSAGWVEVGQVGVGYFQHQGGNVSLGNLFNGSHGIYNLTSGSLAISGALINDGSFAQSAGTFSGNVTNNSNISLSGGTFTVAAGGMVNYGLFSFYGGTLQLNGPSSNQGYMQLNGNATISGSSAFINYGTIAQGSGTATLSGAAVTNVGNIQLTLAGALNLNGANFTNNGTINLNGARIGGSATLVNRYGATITGNGLISAPFDNQGGRLLLTNGTTFISQAFATRGIIQLTEDTASLSGGAISNTGQILGHGSISNDLTNSGGGSIEASGGALILGGLVNNTALGSLAASTGSKLFLSGGMSTNAGLINLTGGAFDNNGINLSNIGQISGFGTIRTGTLTNNGSMTLTGGFTTVNGNVTNTAGKQIKIAYNPALFTGNVVNNGTFKTTSTTATFSGSYTENGTFISDPSDTYFMDVFLNAPGSWTGGVGDRFFVKGVLDWSGGSMTGSGAVTFNQGSATLHDVNEKTLSGWTFNNEKPLAISGGNINMGNGAVINNTDGFTFQSDAGFVNTLGGSATFANSGAGVLRKTGGAGTSNISALVANNGGTIDVQTGTIALNGGLNIAAGTTLPKIGAGTLSIAGPQAHGAGAQLTDTAGRINLNSNAGTPATAGLAAVANLTVNVTGSGASVVLGSNQDLKALNIPFASAGNQSFDLNAPATPGGFNAVRIYATDLAAAKTTLYAAMKNANIAGSLTPTDGIYDSGRAAHAGTGAAIARLIDAHGDGYIQLRLAKIGDLNLDNQVTISDFIDLASNFNSSGPNITWQEGDLNYDGQVTISDFIDLASNFNSTYSGITDVHPGPGGDLELLAAFASSIGVDPAVIGSAVPEPGTLGLLSIAALALTRRRRSASR